MRPPSNSELIAAWERGAREHPVDRALTLLSACSQETREDLAQLTVGERDIRLLEIYRSLFGPQLEAFAYCPNCNEPLEYTLSADSLLASFEPAPDPSPVVVQSGPLFLRLRLPDSSDLRALQTCPNRESGSQILLERCVLEANLDDSPITAADISPEMIESISSALAAADPRSEILINLKCDSCGHAWQLTLDIERFLWAKVSASAKRLLRDVHTLASAYGWREPDILSLSAVRRQTYVEMTCPTF